MEDLRRRVERAEEALRQQEALEERRTEEMAELMRRVERAEAAERARAAEAQLLRDEVQELKRKQEGAVGEETNAQVEGRLQKILDASLQKTLDVFFPRVEAMVERRPPPEQRSAAPSASAASAPSQPPSPQRRDALGRVLLVAAYEGNVVDIQSLLVAGADIDIVVHGSTPLMRAAEGANAPVVSLLLQRGANVRARDGEGCTALHRAAKYDHSGRCVLMLLCAGADVHCTNNIGLTPLHLAYKVAVVDMLRAAGAGDNGKTPRV